MKFFSSKFKYRQILAILCLVLAFWAFMPRVFAQAVQPGGDPAGSGSSQRPVDTSAGATRTVQTPPPGKDKSVATTGSTIASFLSYILYFIAWAFGSILDLMITVMVYVANYGKAFTIPAVETGWVMVRDLCNNFFIVILLISAVGTVLQRTSYSYKNILPRLLAMAVMINFSKLMTDLLIDLSQIIMLTFASQINSLQGQAIILQAVGLTGFFKMNADNVANAIKNTNGVSVWDVMTAMVFAVIVSVSATVVIFCITIILVYRLVTLMFLIILSPIAFAGSILDSTKGIVSQWWTKLNQNLILGPVMLFFLYLSFMIMAGTGGTTPSTPSSGLPSADLTATARDANGNALNGANAGDLSGLSQTATPVGVFNFLVVLGLLVGSLTMSQQFAGAGAGVASKGLGALNKMKSWGAGKVSDVTGFSTAKGVASQYLKQRSTQKQELRQEKIEGATAGLKQFTGKAKQVVAWAPNKIGSGASSAWNKVNGKATADKLQKEIAKSKETLETKKEEKDNKFSKVEHLNNIEKGEVFIHDNVTYTRSKDDDGVERWQAKNEKGEIKPEKINQDDLINIMSTGSNVNRIAYKSDFSDGGKDYQYDGARAEWRATDQKTGVIEMMKENELTEKLGGVNSQIINSEISTLDNEVKAKEEAKKKADRRQKVFNGLGKGALVAAGAVSGLATGGVSWVGLGAAAVGGYAGYKMVPGAADAVKETGKGDLKLAGKYEEKQLKEAQDRTKDLSNDEVLATMDDESKDKFTKAAAALEAVSRKLVSSSQAGQIRDRLVNETFKKDGVRGNDYINKKVSGKAEALLEKNYPEQTKIFRDANVDLEKLLKDKKLTEDSKEYKEAVEKKAKAQKEIKEGFADGTYSMKDMNNDAIARSIGEIAQGMKTGAFSKQFADFSAAKQDAIVKALDKNGTKESREKLAAVRSIERAFGKGASASGNLELKEYLKKMSAKQYTEIINNGNEEQQNSLKVAVGGKPEYLPKTIAENAGRSAANIRKFLGVPEPPAGGSRSGGAERDNVDDEEETT